MPDAVPFARHPSTEWPKLRGVLAVDAATCVSMGALLVLAVSPLSAALGLPHGLLFWAGVLLFPCAALMGVAAAMRRAPALLVSLVIFGNAVWVVASVIVAVVLDPTPLGVAFVSGQAAVVLGLLVLEHRGRRLMEARAN